MFIALAVAASALSCNVEQAHYTLRTAPDITATFRALKPRAGSVGADDWPSHLALSIHLAKTNRTYWFLPEPDGTAHLQHFASTTDVTAPDWKPPSSDGGPRPLGEIDYVATDANYKVIDAVPRLGDLAPTHILFAGLGEALWYRTPWDRRDGAPKQFFDLAACKTNP